MEFSKTQQNNCVEAFTLPFLDAHGRTITYENEKKLFVKLSSQLLVDGNQELNQDELEQLFATTFDINMEEIISEDITLTVVSGIAGIGKSTLVKQLMNAWSNGEIWGSSLLVIPISCCDLNKGTITEETTILDIIRKLHPDLDKLTSMDFQEIGGRTVILIDSVDELTNVKSIASAEITPCVQILMDLLDGRKTFFKWRVLFGRPHTSRIIQNVITGHLKQKFTSVEICGFDEQNLKMYIRNLFNNNPERAEMLERKIQVSKTLSAMLNVPSYLWAICGVYQQLPLEDVPKTYTELLLYNILLFQQKHWLSKELSMTSLDAVVNNPKILKCTKLIAKLAYLTLCERKKIIRLNIEEGNMFDEEVQQAGLVIYCNNHVEFPHLAIQELFTAIYIMLEVSTEERNKMLGNSALAGCFSFVAGLEGLVWSEKNSLPHILAKNLLKDVEINTQTPFIASMEIKLLKILIQPTLMQPSENTFPGVECLQCFYEFQMIKPTLLLNLMAIAMTARISINYIGSTNLYLIDHLVDLFIRYDIPFSVNQLYINSDLLEYGEQSFIRRLILSHSQKIKGFSIEVNDRNIRQINDLVHVFFGCSFDLNTITVMDRTSGDRINKVFDGILLAVSNTLELRFENSNVSRHLFYELSKLQASMKSLVIDRCVIDFDQTDRWHLPESLKSLTITNSVLSDDFACFITKVS